MKKILFVMATAVGLLFLVACAAPSTEPEAQTTPVVDELQTDTKEETSTDQPLTDQPLDESLPGDPIIAQAPIRSVYVEKQDEEYWLVVEGDLADGCTQIQEISQEVSPNLIRFTITTSREADRMCTQMITPFTEKILVDTASLAGADYKVVVNDLVADQTINTSSLD